MSGHLESTNRCQVDFKMMKFFMCKYFLTEIVIIILLSASMSCSLKKANKIDNMQILLSSVFFVKAEVSFFHFF